MISGIMDWFQEEEKLFFMTDLSMSFEKACFMKNAKKKKGSSLILAP